MEQAKQLKFIDTKSPNFQNNYREQRAHGAYIITICQLEAAFNLLVTAQHQNPTKADITALNKRLA